jgi:toxin-antitoxin system PIN domain toxin
VKYLLDVNALLAAIWTDHTSHSLADKWINGKLLVTCPFSELGFLRISTHPKALGATMTVARQLLQDFLTKHTVEFLPADLPALRSRAANSDEVTDFYLAQLAASKDLRLATLDRNISHPSVALIR